ncbi:MAG: hypothetical protein GY898_03775 [Proteobacteria bacterium]|nr:hypothetical protein [Pseudomonadota bacterium]
MLNRSLLFLAAALWLPACAPWLEVDCPDGSAEGDDGLCVCDSDRFGAVAWDDGLEDYTGECRTGLEEAVRTGDPSTLPAAPDILEAIADELDGLMTESELLLRDLHGDGPIFYSPGSYSHHINSSRPEDTFLLLQGSDAGYSLAAVGQQGAGRYAGFGSNPVVSFAAGNAGDFRPTFDRLMAWMMTGDVAGSLPESATVAVGAIGWEEGNVVGWFAGEQPGWTVETCVDAACLESRDLLVLGASPDADEDVFGPAARAALEAGTPVLFLQTEGWVETAAGIAVLAELGMTYGGYGGNYWAEDYANWDSVSDMLALGGVLGSLDALVGHFAADDFDFDWDACTTYVGQTSCDDVAGLREEFLNGAEALKGMLAYLDGAGIDLFAESGRRLSKLCVLLADRYRSAIAYPLNKADADVAPFLASYFADHVVHYRRGFNPAQSDLGSFSGPVTVDDVEVLDVTPIVEVSRHGGFTSIGYSALPGEVLIVRAEDAAGLRLGVHLNTQRTGSTREFGDGSYDRPKFLRSPRMPLVHGEDVRIVSPYGGTLQLWAAASEAGGTVELAVEGVARHPVLRDGVAPADWLEELQTTPLPFAEIETPYVQVHSKTDMMLGAVGGYSGGIDAFLTDVQTYMVQDTYELAGFVGKGLSTGAAVLDVCDDLGWDCTDATVHGRPAVQHINVDRYAHCGGGCSGNPYDQTWVLGPLGWGETHEIGHNLQRGRLNVYGWQSSEVSNQIFPLHKHWSWRADTGESLTPDRVDYRGAFDLFQAGGDVFATIWEDEGYAANNGLRMGFWMQARHHAASLGVFDTGWDLFTLSYLHERLFSRAASDETRWADEATLLGFDQYATAPEIDGNDFLLITWSLLTETDLRPMFDLWDVTYGAGAAEQVEAYGYEPVPVQMWVSDDVNGEPYPDPIPIDGVSEWPL